MKIPRLHPDTIEEVKQRLDIVDIISESVVLKKRGKDYLGLCPFHEEKTPSFSVSPTKQLYYCFGCSAGGDAFKFLMEVRKDSFSDVVLSLAERYQVPIQTLAPEERQEIKRELSLREQLYEILALAASFYHHALLQSEGEKALKYLLTKRKFKQETIQKFNLGYAPAGWNAVYRYLVETKKYPVALVERAGLIKPRSEGKGYYDRFRDRLVIPIQDTQGRTIAFGTRSLGDELPKYINSPETNLFNKSKTLFALDKARQSISKADKAVVVEGYFDAIALHTAGITNVVASLGTAFTPHQLRQLLRYTESKQVVLNFDADAAGIKATQRAIKEIEPLVYSGQVQLRVLNLPGGKDADEFMQENADAGIAYEEAILNAPLWLDWQINQLLRGKNLTAADQFEQVAQEIIKLLQRIEDSNKRTHYLSYCAEILSQGDGRLIPLHAANLIAQLKKPKKKRSSSSTSSREKKKQSDSEKSQREREVNLTVSKEKSMLGQAEADLLRIYLHFPHHRQTIITALEEKDLIFSLAPHRFLWQQIGKLPQKEKDLISLLQDSSISHPEKMDQVNHFFHFDEKTEWEDTLRSPLVINAAIATLEKVSCEQYRRYCLQRWQTLDLSKEPEQMEYYYKELQAAEQRIKELEQQRCFDYMEIDRSVED